MLKVKTYLATSTIPEAGLGLFAGETIEKGTIVWEFIKGFDVILPEEQMKNIDSLYQEFIAKYGYFDKELNSYIICLDNARFFNHSEDSNCDDSFEIGQALDAKTIANKKIEKGEELLCNYFVFDHKATEKLF